MPFLITNFSDAKRRNEKSVNLTDILSFGQHVTNVVIAEVLKQPYPKRQAKYLDYFIEVGDVCLGTSQWTL